jgi:cell division protein ZapE
MIRKIDLKKSFKEFCKNNKFEVNPQQTEIVGLLDRFLNQNDTFLSRLFKKNKLCFYLHGKVGVGKTMLLNYVYDRLETKKFRQHFNQFMINFHDFRHEKKDGNNIRAFVQKIKKKYNLIYLDEFQVTNIVDAMILGKLFEVIFEENIKIIITTNTKLNDLYKDGLQREQFMPFISTIKKFAIQKELLIKDDYRKLNDKKPQDFFFPLNERTSFKVNQRFREISRDKKKERKIISTKGRNFIIENFFSGTARFKFKDLCEKNIGAEDYINIANICNHIFIEEIPKFNNENSNQQLRFITLIDILYEKKIKLTLTLDQDLLNLSTSIKHSEVFKRTKSRLFEMTKYLLN